MTKMVYIAGLARSGSTLLELLLAAHEGVVTTGELQVWPHEIGHPTGILPCGCGQPVSTCEFWAEVRGQVDPLTQSSPRLHRFRETHYWGYTTRPTVLPHFGSRTLSSADQSDVVTYGTNTAAIIEAVARVYRDRGIAADVVVDASKDPYRALWLARSGLVDLRVIHLMRDPRAAVLSLTTDEETRRGRMVIGTRRAMAWNLENMLIDAVLRNHVPPEHGRRVAYEDLATDPVGTIEMLAEFVGVTPDPSVVETHMTNPVHSVAGNPMRQERRAIRLDTRWTTELDPAVRWTTAALTKPVRAMLEDRSDRYEERR